MIILNIPDGAKIVIKQLQNRGYEAYLVGGCVRDSLLEKEPKDYDITTSATPDQVIELFEKVVPTGIKHGTVTVIENEESIEVTTFRKDGSYSDGRRPDEVFYSDNIEEDLKRRDFTMNAIAFDGVNYVDRHFGISDIENKIVRAVGSPNKRFKEDALRMLRAVRFACQLDFAIQTPTYYAIKDNAHLIRQVSNERVRDELVKILMSDNPSMGIRMLADSGLLQHIIPELDKCVGFNQQNPHHDKDVFNHILAVVEATPAILEVRLSALFHDIAKPETFTVDEQGIGHFYTHEIVGEKMTEDIMRRLKFDTTTIEVVCLLVKEHMSRYKQFSSSTIKRLINRVGAENIYNLFHLQIADILGHVPPHDIDIVSRMKDEADRILNEKQPLSVKDLQINGHDIMRLGFKQGKEVGRILNYLLEVVIESPEMNNFEKLKQIVLTEPKKSTIIKR